MRPCRRAVLSSAAVDDSSGGGPFLDIGLFLSLSLPHTIDELDSFPDFLQ